MTQAQITLVKNTWSKLREVDPLLIGDVFYSRLFIREPSLKKMFSSSMEEQYKKIIEMLNVVVSRLESLDELTNDIREMVVQHAGYGVKDWHYKVVGDSLLWTLQQGLGLEWTGDVKAAWETCYNTLAQTMMEAVKESE